MCDRCGLDCEGPTVKEEPTMWVVSIEWEALPQEQDGLPAVSVTGPFGTKAEAEAEVAVMMNGDRTGIIGCCALPIEEPWSKA